MIELTPQVKHCLRLLGTNLTEWRVCDILGLEDGLTHGGQRRATPIFDRPEGYVPAKTQHSHRVKSCQLCGHPTPLRYWAQCARLKLLLPLCSGCVALFTQGVCGEILVVQAMETRAYALLEQVLDLEARLTFTSDKSTEEGFNVLTLCDQLQACIGPVTMKSKPAAVARWYHHNNKRANQVIEVIKAYYSNDSLNPIN